MHNFQDTPDDTCQCSSYAETTNHYLLKCSNFNLNRNELFQTVNPILVTNNMYPLSENELVHILLYGHEKLQYRENKTILQAVMNFIGNTSRFSET